MKRLTLLLLLTLLSCTSCTALPAEERAFAVVLSVEKEAETWRVHARIPTYQTGGGYLTVSGEGANLSTALTDMDASAPMHLHLSQLRLLVLDEKLGDSADLATVFEELSTRADMRLQCAVAVTNTPAKELMDALKPTTGARLSKTIDVLLDTRIEQGGILPATLADVIRMGERQSPVLIALALEDKDLSLSGGYPLTADLRLGAKLPPDETALLSMMLGHAKNLRISLPGGSAEVREVSARFWLEERMQSASMTLKLRTTASSFTPDGLEQVLAEECLSLLARLSAEGCDVMGLGRKAVLRTHDMLDWHELNWPEQYRQIRWNVSVGVNGPA